MISAQQFDNIGYNIRFQFDSSLTEAIQKDMIFLFIENRIKMTHKLLKQSRKSYLRSLDVRLKKYMVKDLS